MALLEQVGASLQRGAGLPLLDALGDQIRQRHKVRGGIFQQCQKQDEGRTGLVGQVREELVQKYLDQGASRSKAEKEVDYFLSDDRSQEYLEMREYALTQKDDGLGIDLFLALQFVGAFVIGFLGHSLSNNGASFW